MSEGRVLGNGRKWKTIECYTKRYVKGAFCECSFSHQACIKSTRILEQAKVEIGNVQKYKIQGGRGWVIDGVQVSTIEGVNGNSGALQYRASPRAGH